MQGHTEGLLNQHGGERPGRSTATRVWRTRHGAQVPAISSTTTAPEVTLQPYFTLLNNVGVCECQFYGKSGVPYPSGKCMVCGYRVNLEGAIA